MKKIIGIVLVAVLGLGLVGCGSGTKEKKQDDSKSTDVSKMDENSIRNKLNEFGGWVSNDIYSNLIQLDIYEKHGEDNGKDMEFIYAEYIKGIKKENEFNTFITSLKDSKYDDLKSYWSKLKAELEIVDKYVSNNKIVANGGNNFDTKKLSQYKKAAIKSLYDLGL